MPELLPWMDPSIPDDEVLFDRGIMRAAPPQPAPERVMLITCGALFRETQACLARHGWFHVDTECLPARFHTTPDQIGPALRARSRVAMARGYGKAAALFGDCGSAGSVAHFCAEEGIAFAAVPHCGAMYDARLIDSEPGEDGVFFLTDFMVRHFEAMFWQPMRLDNHQELIQVIFAPYDRVVHLAQTNDASLDKAAIRIAVKLNMPLERRPAPTERLAVTIRELIAQP